MTSHTLPRHLFTVALLALPALSTTLSGCIFSTTPMSTTQGVDMGGDMNTETHDMALDGVTITFSPAVGAEGDAQVHQLIARADRDLTLALSGSGSVSAEDLEIRQGATLLGALLNGEDATITLGEGQEVILGEFTVRGDKDDAEGEEALVITISGVEVARFTIQDGAAATPRKYQLPITFNLPDAARDDLATRREVVAVPMTFPLSVVGNDQTFWANVQADGGDLIVRDHTGACVPLEVGTFRKDERRGELFFLATVHPDDAATQRYTIEFGTRTDALLAQPPADDPCGRFKVWDRYLAVWHMRLGVDHTIHDATRNEHHLAYRALTGGTAPPTQFTGQEGDAVRFLDGEFCFEATDRPGFHDRAGFSAIASVAVETRADSGAGVDRLGGAIVQLSTPAHADDPTQSHLLLSAHTVEGANANTNTMMFGLMRPVASSADKPLQGVVREPFLGAQSWNTARITAHFGAAQGTLAWSTARTALEGAPTLTRSSLERGVLRLGAGDPTTPLRAAFQGTMDEVRVRAINAASEVPGDSTRPDAFHILEFENVHRPHALWATPPLATELPEDE